MATLSWSEPIRVRRSVNLKGRHLGYVTTIEYPNRDLTAFAEGSPYREIVIADPREKHVALLQRYKEHWLIQCGESYDTTERGGELSERQAMVLAALALVLTLTGEVLVAELKQQIEKLLIH